MIRHKLFLFILFYSNLAFTQYFSGNVLDQQEKALQGVVVYWLNSQQGGTTNENGFFRLARKSEDSLLVLSYTGFQSDTLKIEPNQYFSVLHLNEGLVLKEVQVDANRNSNTFSRLNPLNIEGLEQKEFKKAACCSLSESFQTSNAVDVSYSNAATGSKEIQFLGLRGLYTQLLIENRPAYAGILSSTGYDLIPGTWLDKVNIQKGASTALYGAQSMAGAINVQLKKPHDDYPLYVNLFGDMHGRIEANVHLNKVWSEKNASGIYLNGSFNDVNKDHNGDSFQDDSKINRFNGLIRNTFFSNTWEGQLNGQAIFETRKSGQINTESPYLISQEISHANLFGNLGYVNFEKELQNAGSIYDLSYSKIKSFFGSKIFEADEKRVSLKMLYNHPFADGIHQIMIGPAFQYNIANETFGNDKLDYKESVAALFMDYSFRNNLELNNSFSLTVSQRLELINGDDAIYIPRFNMRYLFAEDWTVRASIGRGYRFPRIFSDQSALFATAKIWDIENAIKIEKSWNTGMNIVGKPYINGEELEINLDAYYTWFEDQIVIDLDDDYQRVKVYNLNGRSFAFQTIGTISYPVLDQLRIKIGGKFTDAQTNYHKGLRQNLMVPKYRGLISLDFESSDKKWLWNVSANFVGKMRLADKDNVPHELIHDHTGYSEAYTQLQSQLTFTHKVWEFYCGVENILDYTQHSAIIDPFNPYGSYFNAAEVYAPVAGIKPYIGIKWKMNRKP